MDPAPVIRRPTSGTQSLLLALLLALGAVTISAQSPQPPPPASGGNGLFYVGTYAGHD